MTVFYGARDLFDAPPPRPRCTPLLLVRDVVTGALTAVAAVSLTVLAWAVLP
jgi:hypothetical protein